MAPVFTWGFLERGLDTPHGASVYVCVFYIGVFGVRPILLSFVWSVYEDFHPSYPLPLDEPTF